MTTSPWFACIEAGGTKFITGLARGPGDVIERMRFDTISPDVTLGAVSEWLAEMQSRYNVAALGIASFGPIELDPASPNWGYITNTVKPGWANSSFAQRLRDATGLPTGLNTDVNGSALSEARWGAGRGQKICAYITDGTGIGGGILVDGQPLIGLTHPEMGHIHVPRHPKDPDFPGVCLVHGDCVEGLASGPAIMKRWGASLSDLPADHEAHEIIAFYLAHIAMTFQAIMEPGRIIFGGGVLNTLGLINRIQDMAVELGYGYFRGKAHDVITLPELGNSAGLLGALILAEDALAANA